MIFLPHPPEDIAPKSVVHPLFGGGACRWPGCERIFDDFDEFYNHLQSDHINGDYSAAQARIQMEVVCQLHLQLQKERDRLQAMILHLNKKNEMAARIPMAGANPYVPQIPPPPPPYDLIAGLRFPPAGPADGAMVEAALQLTSKQQQALHHHQQQQHHHQQQQQQQQHQQAGRASKGSIRAKYFPPSQDADAGGFKEVHFPDVQDARFAFADVQKNREFYRSHDVRPPFTYASLIRQSIIESPEKQLTLNEIYNWFQNTFCYFRRNAATWKNAIRTNLSLHKCFVRYEDDFGSFWMVDDNEFLKRRHLSRGRPRKYDIAMPLDTPVDGLNDGQPVRSGSSAHSNAAPGGGLQAGPGDISPLLGATHCYDDGSGGLLRSPKKEFPRR
ncbi:forkhead box protein P1-B isoform X4 [Ochlerotatus camptorhynchus]|uniref:forkhead box protein P1-B isoform X4 n=1 Tax=Ochlerotatus camptorhynchus TaxID=644619 RepID=UPI0031D2E0EE